MKSDCARRSDVAVRDVDRPEVRIGHRDARLRAPRRAGAARQHQRVGRSRVDDRGDRLAVDDDVDFRLATESIERHGLGMDSFLLIRDQAGDVVDAHGVIAPDVRAEDGVRGAVQVRDQRVGRDRFLFAELQHDGAARQRNGVREGCIEHRARLRGAEDEASATALYRGGGDDEQVFLDGEGEVDLLGRRRVTPRQGDARRAEHERTDCDQQAFRVHTAAAASYFA